MKDRFAYYDREADIVWIPTGPSSDVVSEETSWGLIDRDRGSRDSAGLEIWSASDRIPAEVLESLPAPAAGTRAA